VAGRQTAPSLFESQPMALRIDFRGTPGTPADVAVGEARVAQALTASLADRWQSWASAGRTTARRSTGKGCHPMPTLGSSWRSRLRAGQ